eukprot:CAMPEP_0119013654 /NCGR_PEP_ID=MMETSP1176-20130426/8696_1 /TAXON_ID=265551 /ORGANISM="Synedropsis recta cf, Strain CCMP1620" /LENGTH=132 /DNA_ID=CAMNT_0006966759 /DNA_START=35 /DNA_END=433 /DNA_ORIENTATION=+
MKISTFLDATNGNDNNAVVYTSESSGQNTFELIAFNVPRAKTQSVKNLINTVARREIRENQVVLTDGLEFRTVEAKGEIRSIIINQFMPEADCKSEVRLMILLPRDGSQVFDSIKFAFEETTTGKLVQEIVA